MSNIEDILVTIYATICDSNGNFRSSKEIKTNLGKVAEWLKGDKKLGLLLQGYCGNGKTTTLKAIQQLVSLLTNQQKKISIVSAIQLAELAKANDSEFDRLKKVPILAIDDLGVEPIVVVNFGNESHPIIEIICYRYDHRLPILATTNLDKTQLTEKYGDRIYDRLREVCEIIIYKDKSYRQ